MAFKRQLTDAQRVWNRACFHDGHDLREGDRALEAVLLVNGYIFNGGVGHAFDLEPEQLARGIAGYEYFGLHDLVAIIKPHRGEDEHVYNTRYYELDGRRGKGRIMEAFEKMFQEHPERFAPL